MMRFVLYSHGHCVNFEAVRCKSQSLTRTGADKWQHVILAKPLIPLELYPLIRERIFCSD